ncbi:hypothetical protein ACJX0J_014529 [Zea mays]
MSFASLRTGIILNNKASLRKKTNTTGAHPGGFLLHAGGGGKKEMTGRKAWQFLLNNGDNTLHYAEYIIIVIIDRNPLIQKNHLIFIIKTHILISPNTLNNQNYVRFLHSTILLFSPLQRLKWLGHHENVGCASPSAHHIIRSRGNV